MVFGVGFLQTVGQMAAQCETLIFVDVDGVLNVGIEDGAQSAVELSKNNMRIAERCRRAFMDTGAAVDKTTAMIAARLDGVWNRTVLGNTDEDEAAERYCKFHAASNNLSDVLVGRLADIINAAGDTCSVVLSSTWRLPRQQAKAADLERALSKHLGYEFTFHDRTAIRKETTPGERLVTIGNYLREYCDAKEHSDESSQLRVLVMDDFSVTTLDRWSTLSDMASVHSLDQAEKYLQQRARRQNVTAKILHTYDEFKLESGLPVRIGCGLMKTHLEEAFDFLETQEDMVALGRYGGC
eukprot:TRINITY_DN35631_c0_g1_i1.p1 TRINITY_DN35631_c0_g1~~TRINITY_DN35631_c0_g1_i1.p1  ORF type:complete len:297 (+),score=71.19 TRINITY_DN35631_c0_g1_i1:23-913(+)